MTDHPDIDTHPDLAPDADLPDLLMVTFTDALETLNRLENLAIDIACPGCDPDGSRTETVRVAVRDRYALVAGDADLLLGRTADVRAALLGVLATPCHHHHDTDDTTTTEENP